MIFENRLKFTAASLSAQTMAVGVTITAGAAATNCRTPAQCISDGAADPLALKVGSVGVPFTVDDGAAWQDVECTVTSATVLTVTKLGAGSNGASPVTFASSTPTVFNCPPASWLRRVPVDTFPAAFSTAVPLTQIGTVHMPRQQVAGNLTFTAMAGAVRGALAEYLLILDGTSTLTFTGFTEHGSSSGLLNTSGMPNTVWFWYDGYTYWWSASQAANPVALDIVAPTMASGAVANATPATVTLTASEALDPAYVPAASTFTISGHTVLAVTGISGLNVTLSVSAAVVNGESLTGSYTQPATNGLRDLAGNLMNSFTGLTITNNVAAVDTQAPTYVANSAQVSNASPTIVQFTMSETLANSIPPGSSLTITENGTAKTVNSVAISGANVSATCATAFSNGTTIQLSYAAPGANPRLQDAAGNITGNFGPVSVINNVAAAGAETLSVNTPSTQTVGTQFVVSGTWANVQPANLDYRLSDDAAGAWTQVAATINANGTWSFNLTPASASPGRTISVRDRVNTSITATSGSYVVNAAGTTYPRLALLAHTSESGTGPYTYTGDGTQSTYGSCGANSANPLPANGDGYIDFKIVNPTDGFVGFYRSSAVAAPNALDFAIEFKGSGGNTTAYQAVAWQQTTVDLTTSFAPAVGDILRVKRTGKVFTAEIARAASPTTFTVMNTYSYANGTAPQMWAYALLTTSSSVQIVGGGGWS